MDFLSADSLTWLREPRKRLRDAHAAGRLPQSLLLESVPGLGAEQFAGWIAALALCEAVPGSPGAPAPCGNCASCRLLRSDSHPDLHLVRLLEDAQQIKVDQIRELIDSLSLSSYRGGYKVAVVESAEALNANGANAFLKTLEEPSGRTLLMLIARPSHRLPATISSRCLRLKLHPPSRSEALDWLAAREPGTAPWGAALALAGGAPLLARELPPNAVVRLDREMQSSLEALAADKIDVSALADAWIKSDAGLRLIWLENWITQRVRTHLAGVTSLETAEPVRLPAALLKPKIRALFELLDSSRELRRLASTGLNQQLALEALLLGGRAALVNQER